MQAESHYPHIPRESLQYTIFGAVNTLSKSRANDCDCVANCFGVLWISSKTSQRYLDGTGDLEAVHMDEVDGFQPPEELIFPSPRLSDSKVLGKVID